MKITCPHCGEEQNLNISSFELDMDEKELDLQVCCINCGEAMKIITVDLNFELSELQ